MIKGTKHEEDWVFYHDALTQLKCQKTMEWMETNGYLKRWVLSMNGANEGTKFAGRPVGNSPEMMCLDCSLFKDVDDAAAFHITLTSWMKKDHELYEK